MQSSSRNGAKVRVLAVHTTEGIMRAADLRAWATWPGSSHASADETGVLLAGAADGFVDYDRSAWTLRNGNAWSENIELCGYAKWKRNDWLARPKLLDACARWLAERSVARGIPLVKLSPKELAAGRSGVIGHVDYTQGYSDGSHWDPGPNFPYDVVLAQAAAHAGGGSPAPIDNSGEDDMLPEEKTQLAEVHWMLTQIKPNADRLEAVQKSVDEVNWGVLDESQGLRVLVGGLYAKLADLDAASGITAADIAALIPDGIASEVADELQRRLAS